LAAADDTITLAASTLITAKRRNALMKSPQSNPQTVVQIVRKRKEKFSAGLLRDGGAGPVDDRAHIGAGRHGPEGASRITGEPRGAERVGDGAGSVPHEERALEYQGEVLHQTAGP
jgi:hypothetical protein